MRPRTSLPTLALLVTVLLLTLACSGTPRGTEWYRGSNLVMRVTDLQHVEEVRFASGDKHYVIRPSEEGRVLATVKMELQNSEGNIAFLSIREGSVTLRDKDQEDYTAINYLERQVEVQESHPKENAFSPFIWGDVELPGRCGEPLQTCQLVGWLIFEVPEGLDPLLVLWEAADTIYIRF